MRAFLILALLTAGAAGHAAGGDDDETHLSELDGVRVVHAWTRAGGGATADVYLEIENDRDSTVVLLGGESGLATNVVLMAMPLDSGATNPVELPGMPVAPGTELALSPGGLFLRLSGVSETRVEGADFEMHIAFQDIGEVEIHVAVEAADADRHSHAGHAH